MKIIRENKTGKVKYAFTDDERIIIGKDTIRIPNNPPPRVVVQANGRIARYLGGTEVWDLNKDNAEVIELVDNVPADFKGNKYIYDKIKKEFSLNPEFSEIPG